MYEIRVEPFGHTYECDDEETILEAALRSKLFLRYGCRHGGCGTCKVDLIGGDVDLTASSYSLPPSERDQGKILVCQSYPLDDCVIDVGEMNLGEEEFYAGDLSGAYQLHVESITELTHDVRRIVLRHHGDPMPFVAGQFVNVIVPGTREERSYSMANGSSDNKHIELICKLLPGGLFSEFLVSPTSAGTEVAVTGPFGNMAIRLSHREIVMVAGGSGLAPLLAMLRDLVEKPSPRRVTLFFGARTEADLYALEELEELCQALPDLTFVPVVAEPSSQWDGAVGLVTDGIAAHRESYERHDAYLCGPPGMIDAATVLLVDRGVRPQNVHFDAFVPTGSTEAS